MVEPSHRASIVRDVCIGVVASAGAGILSSLVLATAVLMLPVNF